MYSFLCHLQLDIHCQKNPLWIHETARRPLIVFWERRTTPLFVTQWSLPNSNRHFAGTFFVLCGFNLYKSLDLHCTSRKYFWKFVLIVQVLKQDDSNSSGTVTLTWDCECGHFNSCTIRRLQEMTQNTSSNWKPHQRCKRPASKSAGCCRTLPVFRICPNQFCFSWNISKPTLKVRKCPTMPTTRSHQTAINMENNLAKRHGQKMMHPDKLPAVTCAVGDESGTGPTVTNVAPNGFPSGQTGLPWRP